ncbi:hypothetical protein chiPu_0027741 [Chiloscyllium punctatum]|uniref:Uncharacterized protein n=1 Tax=Chiloscyllium punctatum TaxID=137246 RepID=A0A401TMR9_CHIPU|nr:hypothetical protein [Chiloscyllium punctatum]
MLRTQIVQGHRKLANGGQGKETDHRKWADGGTGKGDRPLEVGGWGDREKGRTTGSGRMGEPGKGADHRKWADGGTGKGDGPPEVGGWEGDRQRGRTTGSGARAVGAGGSGTERFIKKTQKGKCF